MGAAPDTHHALGDALAEHDDAHVLTQHADPDQGVERDEVALLLAVVGDRDPDRDLVDRVHHDPADRPGAGPRLWERSVDEGEGVLEEREVVLGRRPEIHGRPVADRVGQRPVERDPERPGREVDDPELDDSVPGGVGAERHHLAELRRAVGEAGDEDLLRPADHPRVHRGPAVGRGSRARLDDGDGRTDRHCSLEAGGDRHDRAGGGRDVLRGVVAGDQSPLTGHDVGSTGPGVGDGRRSGCGCRGHGDGPCDQGLAGGDLRLGLRHEDVEPVLAAEGRLSESRPVVAHLVGTREGVHVQGLRLRGRRQDQGSPDGRHVLPVHLLAGFEHVLPDVRLVDVVRVAGGVVEEVVDLSPQDPVDALSHGDDGRRQERIDEIQGVAVFLAVADQERHLRPLIQGDLQGRPARVLHDDVLAQGTLAGHLERAGDEGVDDVPELGDLVVEVAGDQVPEDHVGQQADDRLVGPDCWIQGREVVRERPLPLLRPVPDHVPGGVEADRGVVGVARCV